MKNNKAHELGHWALSHTVKHLVIVQVYILLFLFLFGKTLNNSDLYESFGFHDRSVFIGLVLFNYIYGPVDHLFSLIMNYLSRTFEYQAGQNFSFFFFLKK